MKNIFSIMDAKTMFMVNTVAIVITGICVVFALFIFLTKGQAPDLEHWKYVAIILGLVVVSLLFLGSVAFLFYFISLKNKKK